VAGIALIGLAGALYIGAHYGAGPRDGLMVALHVRGGWSIGTARTVVEASALVVGILLGGPVGVGTALYTVGIGPATQVSFRLLRLTPARPTTTEPV
ncbi:MAG TPA: membrane protein, partial [Mycobacteriales bacterium]|nr:membrane protein [Mycobacteriales bacterium]